MKAKRQSGAVLNSATMLDGFRGHVTLPGTFEDMMKNPRRTEWLHEHEAHLGALNALSASIARWERQNPHSIPSLRNKSTLLIGSDYSRFHQGAQFEITSLITNFETIRSWDDERIVLRRQLVSRRLLPRV